jgi:U3 small nucleolar ribonucleoprotein protein IMP3
MRKLAYKLSQMEPEDPTRRKLESAMLEKLYSMGVIQKSREQGGTLSQVEHLTVSAICRRRLPIVMVREQKMIQYVDKVSSFFHRYLAMLCVADFRRSTIPVQFNVRDGVMVL